MEKIKCCFCGKELPNKIDWNNPEPLCHAYGTVCCRDCDIAYVHPVRRLIWNPAISRTECNLISDNLQGIALDELQNILSNKDPLTALRKRIGWRGL